MAIQLSREGLGLLGRATYVRAVPVEVEDHASAAASREGLDVRAEYHQARARDARVGGAHSPPGTSAGSFTTMVLYTTSRTWSSPTKGFPAVRVVRVVRE